MSFDFAKPSLYIVKSVFTSNVITEEYDVSTPVENASDWAEWLLTGGVPYLQLSNLLIYFDDKRTKLHSNSNLMIKFKIFVHHFWEKTTLANTYQKSAESITQSTYQYHQ